MTIGTDGSVGEAVVVPCLTTGTGVHTLFTEARALWQAEEPGTADGNISASWGCVGVCFRDKPPPADWARPWTEYFHAKKASPIAPVNSNGLLEIPWPQTIADGAVDLDVILATATKANEKRPCPNDIADAWIDQNQGHELYFFENVRHGIRTPEDAQIWRRIENQKPVWLSRTVYAEAIEVLRAEAR